MMLINDPSMILEDTFFDLIKFYCRAFGQFTNITMNETAVLCLTVQNAKYPITLVCVSSIYFFNLNKHCLSIQDVIRKICSVTGQLLRICILRKRNIQVLAEFDSIDTARRTKNELDGVRFH